MNALENIPHYYLTLEEVHLSINTDGLTFCGRKCMPSCVWRWRWGWKTQGWKRQRDMPSSGPSPTTFCLISGVYSNSTRLILCIRCSSFLFSLSKLYSQPQSFELHIQVQPSMTIFCHLQSEDYGNPYRRTQLVYSQSSLVGTDLMETVRPAVDPKNYIALAANVKAPEEALFDDDDIWKQCIQHEE